MPPTAKVPGKRGSSPLLTMIKLLFIGTLLAAAGMNWYLVFLLARDESDFAQIRRFAGITAGFTFSLVVVIIIAVVVLVCTGGAALLFKQGFASISGLFIVILFLLINVVYGLDFAIMPLVKPLIDEDPVVANEGPEKAQARKLAIIAASFGTGLIAVWVFYYVLIGIGAHAKAKSGAPAGHGRGKVPYSVPPIPTVPTHGAVTPPPAYSASPPPAYVAPVPSGPTPAQAQAAANARLAAEAAKAA